MLIYSAPANPCNTSPARMQMCGGRVHQLQVVWIAWRDAPQFGTHFGVGKMALLVCIFHLMLNGAPQTGPKSIPIYGYENCPANRLRGGLNFKILCTRCWHDHMCFVYDDRTSHCVDVRLTYAATGEAVALAAQGRLQTRQGQRC